MPILSIASDKGNFFSHENNEETGGIYIYTGPPVGDATGNGQYAKERNRLLYQYFPVRTQRALEQIQAYIPEPTGISDATRLNNKEESVKKDWYDLQGRRIDSSKLNKGIYIRNGQLVVVTH